MSDALPLPPRPTVEQYKKLAKDLQHAAQSTDPNAIRDWAAHWTQVDAGLIEHVWRKHHPNGSCKLSDAQFFVARIHGFASWPKFASHIQALARAGSPVSNFEDAVDAIVSGDLAVLKRLLGEHPDLVRARSTREHRSTLLHYVSANGIEDFRQKTPRNIVTITRLLLDAGADVNAESDAYGGRSTTLGLTATSVHPENAGVQIKLMELLCERGAIIDRSAVLGCLQNGRGPAAEFFAKRGARLDIEGAAGIGRLDLVRTFLETKPRPTKTQVNAAFAWACQFGHTEVAGFLLQQGVKVGDKRNGQTGLHWAAIGAHVDTVRMLLDRGAPSNVKDGTHDLTALGWANYGRRNTRKKTKRKAFDEVIDLLSRADSSAAPRKPSPRPKHTAKP